MFIKKIKFVLIIFLFYQTALHSKSTSFDNLDSKNISKYFSGIVAFENKSNSKALDFFSSSKILINKHDPYLKRYIYSLVLENKIIQAINEIKRNKGKNNSNFFDAYLLLIVDSLKKNDLNNAHNLLLEMNIFTKDDRLSLAILESLSQYIYTFKEKKLPKQKKNFGKLSIISDAILIEVFSFLSIRGIRHSANLAKFHLVIGGWLEKAYLPNLSIELNTVLGS